MKNQYFGDVNDYRKYGLLRALANDGKLKIGVCWMLTVDDSPTDGKFVDYLEKAGGHWEDYDPALFKMLKQVVYDDKNRHVDRPIVDKLIPGAKFYPELLSDKADLRGAYFSKLSQDFADVDLIFFDPDNGLAGSIARGRLNSSKYLYKDEVKAAYNEGHSLLIYQHFPRENRETFIKRVANDLHAQADLSKIYVFRTSHVAFFLVAAPKHQVQLQVGIDRVERDWYRTDRKTNQITVMRDIGSLS